MKTTYLTKSALAALLLSGSTLALLAQNWPGATRNGQGGFRYGASQTDAPRRGAARRSADPATCPNGQNQYRTRNARSAGPRWGRNADQSERGQGRGYGQRQGGGYGRGQGGFGRHGAGSVLPPTVPLEDGEAEAILFMKQEEKLARDVYLTLYGTWKHNTFRNISIAEQRHMNAVDRLIAAYELEDPTPEEIGEFTIPELRELFEQLVEKGSKSLTDALEAGVLVEETDIADLEDLLAATENAAITQVMSHLLNGSRHHLAAFNRALGNSSDAPASEPQRGQGRGHRGQGHRGGR